MLHFDSKGNLMPYTSIPATISELEHFFVAEIESETRKANFEQLLKYSNDLKTCAGGADLKQWIDGSFVTLKSNPNDIDVVTFLSQKQIQLLGNRIFQFKMEGARSLYKVDAYIVEVYEPGSRFYSYTLGDTAEWYQLFTSAKKNRGGEKSRKGFLQIIY